MAVVPVKLGVIGFLLVFFPHLFQKRTCEISYTGFYELDDVIQ